MPRDWLVTHGFVGPAVQLSPGLISFVRAEGSSPQCPPITTGWRIHTESDTGAHAYAIAIPSERSVLQPGSSFPVLWPVRRRRACG